MLNKGFEDLRAGLGLYYVWIYQAYHDLSAKYKRTILGPLWLSGAFVVMSISYSILFGALFHQKLEVALPYIMSGILVYGLVSFILTEGVEVYIAAGGIIKNHAYPFTFYAFHAICRAFFLFLLNLVVFWIFMVIIRGFSIPSWTILLAIPLALMFMFAWGVLFGMLGARFRDLRFMLPYIAQLLNVLTPLFWHADSIQGWVRLGIELNPFYAFVQIIRCPLIGISPPLLSWEVAMAYTVLGVFLWLFFFPTFRRRIPFWV